MSDEVTIGQSELDGSERGRIRERLLDEESTLDGLDGRLRQVEAKLRRIWYTVWIGAVAISLWTEGRFAFSLPDVQQIEVKQTEVADVLDEIYAEPIPIVEPDPTPEPEGGRFRRR